MYGYFPVNGEIYLLCQNERIGLFFIRVDEFI